MTEYYKCVEQESFNNKHHMSTNAVLYSIPGCGKIPLFVKQFPDLPEYVEGEKSHKVRDIEVNRLDNIAYKYYDTSEFIWIIMAVNNIIDPLNVKAGTVLRILPKSYIEYNLLRYDS